MRAFHIIMGIALIAISIFFPESWLTQLIFIVGGAVSLGVAATWGDRR